MTILESVAGNLIRFGDGITQGDVNVDETEITEMLLSSQVAVVIRVDDQGNRVDDVIFADGSCPRFCPDTPE